MKWVSSTRNKIFLLAPSALIYSVYIIFATVLAIGYSFTKYKGIGKATFCGFDNYIRMINDRYFWIALKNTGIIFLFALLVVLALSFLLALLLFQKLRLRTFCKAVVFSPAIIASLIVGIIWGYIFDPTTGLLNTFLGAVGLESLQQLWIGSTTWSIYSIGIVFCWQHLGFVATIFLAGLASLPQETIEAAYVDGAGFWKRVFYIIIPMMKKAFISVSILVLTSALKVFEVVIMLTNGGPSHASETLVNYAYTKTFSDIEYGYGMSVATITFILCFVFVLGFLFITKGKDEGGLV